MPQAETKVGDMGVITNPIFIAEHGLVVGIVTEALQGCRSRKLKDAAGKIWENYSVELVINEIQRRDLIIRDLEIQLTLLKKILTDQGVKIISTDQAEQLGIE